MSDDTTPLGDVWYLKGTVGMTYLQAQAAVMTGYGLTAAIDGGDLLYGEYLTDAFTSRSAMLDQFRRRTPRWHKSRER